MRERGEGGGEGGGGQRDTETNEGAGAKRKIVSSRYGEAQVRVYPEPDTRNPKPKPETRNRNPKPLNSWPKPAAHHPRCGGWGTANVYLIEI